MLSVMFIRAPIGECDEPSASFQPELAGDIKDGVLTLYVYGNEDFGLREEFDRKRIPFQGQQTFDELRNSYREKVGTVFVRVELRRKPNLSLEQTHDGWCVLNMGGAELEHFEGLVDRLKASGFDAKPIPGRSGFDAVAFPIPEGEELKTFPLLEAIITSG